MNMKNFPRDVEGAELSGTNTISNIFGMVEMAKIGI